MMRDMAITVDRPALNQKAFDQKYGFKEKETKTLKNKLKKTCAGPISCNGVLKRVALEAYNLVPLLETLRTYKWREWILNDAMAGVSVGMIHIPQAMGFALLASVAPVYGLYASFWQVLIYMFLGQCRHLSIGTMAVISLMISPVVERETALWKIQHGDLMGNFTMNGTASMTLMNTTASEPVSEGLSDEDHFRSSVANGVSLIIGMTMFMMGVLQLGILTRFMPPSFISGFTTGTAFHISCTQLKPIFNVKVKRYSGMFNLPRSIWEIIIALPTTNMADFTCSLICFSFLVFIKEFINVRYKKKLKWPFPGDMVVVVLGTLVSYLAHLHERWNLGIIGFVPIGVPHPALPNLDHADTFILEGIITGITSFAISIAMVDILVGKYKYQINPNKELVAYGVTYGLSSFFHCFAGASAPPRCILLELTGGKTQVASFFTSFLLLLVLLFIGPVFRFLPKACLGCIIIVALFPLFRQISVLPRLWRLSKPDLIIWLVTFLVAVFIDVSVSLGVGIVTAIFVSVVPAIAAKGYRYGNTNHLDLRAPAKTHSRVTMRDDIAVFRYESTLFYLTIKNFKQQLFKATINPQTARIRTENTKPSLTDHPQTNEAIAIEETISNGLPDVEVDIVKSKMANSPTTGMFTATPSKLTNLKVIVLDCSPVCYIDLMGIDTLSSLCKEFKAIGISFVLADCNPTLLCKLAKAEMVKEKSEDGLVVFPTVQDAIAAFSRDLSDEKNESVMRMVTINGEVCDVIHWKRL